MNRQEITEILMLHNKWVLGEKDGIKADLYGADLFGINLSGVNFYGVDLRWANLYGANLYRANLYRANLCEANLSKAVLYGANLREANLSRVNLYEADLCGADLSGANFYEANFYGAKFYGAKNVPFIPMACPDEGAFVAWKKVRTEDEEYLVKLKIPEDAKRSSATGRKCRCDKAEVLEITNIKSGEKVNEVINHNFIDTRYEVGMMVFPDRFDKNRLDECSNGIHFFINKQEALNYIIK